MLTKTNALLTENYYTDQKIKVKSPKILTTLQ